MKWSNTGVKTLRSAPAEADLPGQALLIRGGFIKKLSAGLFTYGPFLVRAIQKFENIIREELNKSDCVEILMPMVQPKKVWEQSGRWNLYDDILQRMKNRSNQEFCLGPTHEEVISDYVKNHIQSYRDLPFCLYQIQTKFRDEIRPRFGLLRAKEFIMKDAYSFDLNEAEAEKTYLKMRQAYQNIFTRLGLPFRVVKADSGEIGGDRSEEFHILAEHGEDELLFTDTMAFNKEMHPELKAGDKAPDNQILQSCRGIEVGHIFYLGDKYSQSMGVEYLDSQGKKHNVKMGCYGIGVSRVVQAVAEKSHNPDGLIWPLSVTPFIAHICLLDAKDEKINRTAHLLYEKFLNQNQEVFLDDREEKPGVKFKDADLLGFPFRINVGARDGEKNLVELVERKTGKREKLSPESALTNVMKHTSSLVDK